MAKPFYMVVREPEPNHNNTPTKKHTKEEALKEAQNLAKLHNKTFHVMKCVVSFQVEMKLTEIRRGQ